MRDAFLLDQLLMIWRRTLIFGHLIGQILDLDIGATHTELCEDTVRTPLPFSGAIWTASLDSDWQDEYKKCSFSRRTLTLGDLQESIHCQVEAVEPDLIAEIASWAKKVVIFGKLLLDNISGFNQ